MHVVNTNFYPAIHITLFRNTFVLRCERDMWLGRIPIIGWWICQYLLLINFICSWGAVDIVLFTVHLLSFVSTFSYKMTMKCFVNMVIGINKQLYDSLFNHSINLNWSDPQLLCILGELLTWSLHQSYLPPGRLTLLSGGLKKLDATINLIWHSCRCLRTTCRTWLSDVGAKWLLKDQLYENI